MSNQIKCETAKFWIEDDVIFCKFIGKKCRKEFDEDFLEEYLKAIITLSNGKYFPLLIDLRELNDNYVFPVVRILAKHPDLKSAILSKSFVVNSCFLQFVLIALRRVHDSIIPNRIFTSYEKAIEYSLETNQIFNLQY